MIKEAFKINVKVSKAFRVGKPVEGRDRLLIVTLDTPGVKHDILCPASLLRSTDRWGNIYITPTSLLPSVMLPRNSGKSCVPEEMEERQT